MKKRVYIAGPISKGDLCHNVNQATEAFVALAKAGFAPLCPHWSVYAKPAGYHTFTRECIDCIAHGSDQACRRCRSVETVICEATSMGNDDMSLTDWMGIDLPWVAMADAVLRLPGESTGADMETACARENGIPVYCTVADLIAGEAVKA